MTQWRATAALGRATLVAAVGLAFGLAFGDPVMVMLTAPLAICAALGLLQVPRSTPRVDTIVEHTTLHEGQGTRSRLILTEVDEVEHVARVSGQVPYIALHPSNGVIGRLQGKGSVDMEISPRRWGARRPADEKVKLTSAWAAWSWGPVVITPPMLRVLPTMTVFDSRAEMPQPIGLVGAHRSRREGSGTEFHGIRPFHTGDRLRRINWPVSLRTGGLHVVATRSEEDSAVLILVDALADYGQSGGIDGQASSLDLSVRAAAALAEHFGRKGDRVALRVVGTSHVYVSYGAGPRHHRMVLGALGNVRPGRPAEWDPPRLNLGLAAGTVVMVLSPMLDETIMNLTATLLQRGLPVIVIDTLSASASPAERKGVRPEISDLAWRMRRLERDVLLESLAAAGCPVVPWRGPGTVDQVLRRLYRRARLPQAVTR